MHTRFLLAALSLAFSGSLFSQEKAQTETVGREITLGLGGLDLDNFNWFQLGFKKQKGPERYSRLRFSGHFSGNFDQNSEQISLAADAAGGEETRRRLNDRLFFVRGYEVWTGIAVAAAGSGEQSSSSISVGGGWVFGLQYRFGEQFYLGFEAVPGVRLRLNYSLPDERVAANIRGEIGSAGALHFGVRF